jgi:predicted secreted protein
VGAQTARGYKDLKMFGDKRSKKVLLVAHCILNQNAKIDRCAYYPGAIKEVSRILVDADVGILQMPCPELFCLGLAREVKTGMDTTVESEDTRVARRMAEDQAKTLCRKLAIDLIYQAEEYQKNGFELVGVIGINGSPTCGVETTWSNDQEKQGQGVFIQILDEASRRRNISLPMRGIKAYEPQQAIAVVRNLMKIM